MASRERVLAALHHQETDRPPVDLSGHRSSGIGAIAYARLRRHLGLPARPLRVYDPVQQLAIVDEDVRQLFGVDTIELGRAFAREDRHWRDWTLPDGTPCQIPAWVNLRREPGRWVMLSASGQMLALMPDGVPYFEQTNWPFAERDAVDHLRDHLPDSMWTAIASPPGPLVAGPEGVDVLRAGAPRLRAHTDRAVLIRGTPADVREHVRRVAAGCSSRSTTSWPTPLRKTWWQCTRR